MSITWDEQVGKFEENELMIYFYWLTKIVHIQSKLCDTVEIRFKKESWFKKDCCYNRFFST